MGLILPDIDDINVPRFSCPVNKVNYAALIAKSLFRFKQDELIA